jgi:hypothetical protein
MSTIRPNSSAIGMKSTGETNPRVGLCQRISASTPVATPSASLISGWYCSRNSPSRSARCRSPRRFRWSSASVCMYVS